MARICDITGKKVMVGNNVSHSNRRTKRKFYPNLQTKKFFIPESGEWITLKVSASALRTIDKNKDGEITMDECKQFWCCHKS